MKKRLGLLIVAGILITLLEACSLFSTKVSPVNGILIEVGAINEQTRSSIIDSYKDITSSTSSSRLIWGILSSDPLNSLPKIEKDETIIFANKEYKDLKELTFDKRKMNL